MNIVKMNQQKRIIEHLIEEASTLSNENDRKPPKTHKNGDQNCNPQAAAQFSDFDPVYDFQVHVEIGDGRSDRIFINQNSDPYKEAEFFCQKHKLDSFIVALLAESLKEQANYEKQFARGATKDNLNVKPGRLKGAERLLAQSRLYKWNRSSQQIWRPKESPMGKPKLNAISREIVEKVGKQTIIESANRKFQNRHQETFQKIQNQAKEEQSSSFHPVINPISSIVDRALHLSRNNQNSRFIQLYDQHKTIEAKKEELRKNSLMQIPFKPTINKVSRTIVTRKKSLGDLYMGANEVRSRKFHSSAESTKRRDNRKSLPRNYSNNNINRSLELGHHLYEQAVRRKERAKKQMQKMANDQSGDNWKIIENSNAIIENVREMKIREIYRHLVPPSHRFLSFKDIVQGQLSETERIFMPIFKEMQQINVSLNEEQFVEAGLRLLKYVSPVQRALLIRKELKEKKAQVNLKENIINAKSKQITEEKGYGGTNIYIRGIMYKRVAKNHIEKGMENKVRKELEDCTFKPKVNPFHQRLAY